LPRPLLDFLFDQCAERVFDHDWNELAHAERVALDFRFV
jgi:hypothetical protein